MLPENASDIVFPPFGVTEKSNIRDHVSFVFDFLNQHEQLNATPNTLNDGNDKYCPLASFDCFIGVFVRFKHTDPIRLSDFITLAPLCNVASNAVPPDP